ncbi:MAG: geranylgeranylglyceryl/heptaprenylglyceryl phosphate synthase [Candidatus Aenigmarchaeota archaeon]
MKIGKVESYIHETIEKDGVVFFGLIDPTNDRGKDPVELAKVFNEANADIILIGGSTGVEGDDFNNVMKSIKESVNKPIMLFPGNVGGVSKYADALYFMSLLNSKNPYWITGAHALAASMIVKMGIEAIPTSLLIIEPGETVGRVGEAKLIPYEKPDIAVSYALAGKLLGHRITILERGSGAPGPSSPEMFRAVKKAVGHPVICAGSSKTLDDIKMTVKAGADGIHIASLVEKSDSPLGTAKKLVDFTKKVGKEKKT